MSPIQYKQVKLPRKVLISLPPAMLEQIDFIAGEEHRTRSDLIREALRRYMEEYRRKSFVTHTSTHDEFKAAV